MALLSVLVLGQTWCELEDAPPETTPATVFVPTPELELPAEEGTLPAEPLPTADAALAPLDAGLPSTVTTRREPNVEDYMRRWREALAPLFMTGRSSNGPTVLKAMPRETPSEPDADVEPCKQKVERLALRAVPRMDLVVVVDTSGSMYRALPKVARWLGELEQQLVATRPDAQLLVVAEQRHLGVPQKRDGGAFGLSVASNDALDVLLDGAKGKERWVDSLRSGADLHLVVVTDDEANGSASDYFARLTELLGGSRFVLHLLGGLDTRKHFPLQPSSPLAQKTCYFEGISGLAPGLVYQELARLTNGLRVPLCYADARQILTEELLKFPSTGANASCGWLLDSRGYRVDRVEAVGPARPPSRLLEERVNSNCFGTRRSYRLAEPLLVLCEDTCTALKAEGYDAVEVTLECAQ